MNKKAFVALLIGALLIAFSPVLIKMTNAPGPASAFYRLLFGTATLIIPFVYAALKGKITLSGKGVFLAVLAGVSFTIDMALWTTGIMKSNAAMPTLMGNLAPIWVGIGATFLFKERNGRTFWMGLLLAFSGVAFLLIRDFYFSSSMFVGLIFGLFAGIFYAIYILLTQPGRKYLDTLTFLFISSLASTVSLAAVMLLFKIPFLGYSSQTWTIFVIMGVVIQAGAWFLITFSQGFIPASVVSPTLLAQPVAAGLIAYLMLGEQLNGYQILGGIVVVSGIFFVHYSRMKAINKRQEEKGVL